MRDAALDERTSYTIESGKARLRQADYIDKWIDSAPNGIPGPWGVFRELIVAVILSRAL
jgi:hypothetical protein